ncbi:hypothetical protein PENTCL1PPCAC_10972, partial [Pristionchus entomophagus]
LPIYRTSTAVPMLLCALVVLPLALACGPGGGVARDEGAPTAKPTMKFSYSPPVGWTYSKAATGGQSLDEDAAKKRINSDIEFAVIKAVESYGFSTAGVKVENAVKPDGPLTLAQGGVCKPDNGGTDDAPLTRRVRRQAPEDSYIAEGGVVSKKCLADGKDQEFKNKDITISITSPVALPISSWDNIASKVWASLTANAGVKFYGLIEITK